MRAITLDNEQLLYMIEKYLIENNLINDAEMLSEVGSPKIGRDYISLIIEDL
jgi:hypothetical protein